MAPEFCDGLLGIACLADQEHIWLRTKDSAQSFTKNRMVFDAQDANGIGLWRHNASLGNCTARPDGIGNS
jgi:hypothetical protein